MPSGCCGKWSLRRRPGPRIGQVRHSGSCARSGSPTPVATWRYLAPNTLAETRRILDSALLPRVGEVPLAKLRPEHLAGVYAELLRDGRSDGGPMSPATVQRVHGVARRPLSVGVRWGWLAVNPAFHAMPPRSMRRAITLPTPQQVARLFKAAAPDLGAFVLLAAALGARRGELCGLRWNDVDLDAGHVEIVRSIVIVDGRCVEAPTKTRQARRVALDQATIDALRTHRRRADRAAGDVGAVLGRDAFVFSHAAGRREPWRRIRPAGRFVISATTSASTTCASTTCATSSPLASWPPALISARSPVGSATPSRRPP